MAIAFVQGKGNVSTGTASPAVTLTNPPTSSNLLVAFIHTKNVGTPAITGWTAGTVQSGGTGGSTQCGAMFWKISNGSEQTVTGSITTSDDATITVLEYSGVDGTTPNIGQNSVRNASGTNTGPSVTPTASKAAVVVRFAGYRTSNLTQSGETNVGTNAGAVTERTDVQNGVQLASAASWDSFVTSTSGSYTGATTPSAAAVNIQAAGVFQAASSGGSFAQALTATAVGLTASLPRQTGKLVTATSVAATAALVKQTGKNVTATTVAATATAARQIGKLMTATAVAAAATLTTMKVKVLALTATAVALTASLVRQTSKQAAATIVAVAATLVRQTAKKITATAVACTATLSAIRVFLRALTATAVVVSASLGRQIGKPLAATAVAAAATITRQIAKTLRATTVAASASLSALRVFLRALTATAVVVTGSIQKQMGKLLNASTVAVSASVAKTVFKKLISSPLASLGSLLASFISGGAQTLYTRFFGQPSPDDAGVGGDVDAHELDGTPGGNEFGSPAPRRS